MWLIKRNNSSEDGDDTSPLNIDNDRSYRAVEDDGNDDDENPDIYRESQQRLDNSSYRAFEAWSASQLGFNNFQAWVHTSRAAVIVSIAAVLFLGLAVVGYSFLFEDWPVTDSIYLAVVLFATVGTYLSMVGCSFFSFL